MLDAGRFGLEFFHRFGPAYTAVTGGERPSEDRYDTHHGIAYAKLRADAERHEQVAAALTERILDLRHGSAPVFEAWQGDAAGRAKGSFDGLLARAGEVRDTFAGLAEVLGAAVDEVDRAVYEQASAVAGLWTDRVGGCTRADVDFLVDFQRRSALDAPVTADELGRAASCCGVPVGPTLAADVRGWLDSVFAPAYRDRASAFDAACRTATAAIDDAWHPVSAKLDALPTNPFAGLTTPTAVAPAAGIAATATAAPATVAPATTAAVAAAEPTSGEPVVAPATAGPATMAAAAEVSGSSATEPAAAVSAVDAAPDERSAAVSMHDKDLPATPADRPGGITSALDGPTEGSADTPDTTMHPAASGPPIAAAAPGGVGSGQQNNFYGGGFYGGGFLGGGVQRGGGEVVHQRDVRLTGPPIVDGAGARPSDAIGAEGDPGRYNADAVKDGEAWRG